jgi:Entner-Doudoroff aldolase
MARLKHIQGESMSADLSQGTLARIERGRIVAILRGDFSGVDAMLADVLIRAGVTAIELTVDSPDAFARIALLARTYAGRMAIGGGTVLNVDHVEQLAEAGASFVVSPNRDVKVIAAAVSRGMVAIPGCQTPSEIVEAIEAGAQAVKLFPAQVLGPDFLHAIRAPLGRVRLVPTGGITPVLARAYRDAGAWALGVGSELVGRMSGDVLDEALATRACAFVEAAR